MKKHCLKALNAYPDSDYGGAVHDHTCLTKYSIAYNRATDAKKDKLQTKQASLTSMPIDSTFERWHIDFLKLRAKLQEEINIFCFT